MIGKHEQLSEGDGDTGSRTGGRVTDLSKELEAFWAGSYGSSAHQTRLKPNVFQDRYLVAASVAQKTITVFDLKTRRQIVLFKDVPQADLMEEVTLSRDGRYVVQLNSDGQFFIHEIEIGRLNLMGRAVDDEIIAYTPEGYYLSSYEGAHFVQLRFPGLRGLFPFQQFKSVLERPDLIKKRIEEGGGVLAAPELSPPPSLTVSRSGGGADGSLHKLDVSVRSSTGLKALSLYADAHRIKDVPLSGGEAKFSVDLPELHNARWLTLQARDAAGLVSVPQSVRLSTGKATSSALHAVIVGVDSYADPTLTLKFAEGDARRLGDALQSIAGGYYQRTSVDLRLGNKATRAQILDSLERAVAAASAQDTIVFSFAGHGLADNSGRYFLTPSDFDRQTIGESGLAWADIASVLQKAKARVMVILDACHSGLSGAEQAGTNDDAAAALLGAARAPMLVLAASKGRQLSYENPSWGGGLFTYALVEALSTSRKQYDADKDGAIAVSELYRAVKSIMYANAKGQQTPWLARQDLIGDFALF